MPEVLIRNADVVVTMDDARCELKGADIRLRDGVVAEVLAAMGDQVTDGTLLLALEPEDG